MNCKRRSAVPPGLRACFDYPNRIRIDEYPAEALREALVILSEGLHYAAKKQSDKAYAAGYDKGKSDAVKQQYWLYVSMQRQRNQVGSVRLYPVQLPEQRIDGVTFQPTTKYLRIEE